MTTHPAGEDDLILPPELVTGEAVTLDLRPASFATRALALLLDLVVLGVLLTTVVVVLGFALPGLDGALAAAIALTCVIAVLVGLPVTVETVTRGRSLGKLAAGLRVVRDDAGPIRFRQALVRGLLAVVELYASFGSIALITSLMNPRGKRLGDLLAGTYVVRERGGPRIEPPRPMPPELAGWAAGTDLGRIPDGLALAARRLLARAGTLHPASRERLAGQIADQVVRYVAPAPPAGVRPEQFLAAVLAERRRRDLDRLHREQALRLAREQRRALAPVLSRTSSRLVGSEAVGDPVATGSPTSGRAG